MQLSLLHRGGSTRKANQKYLNKQNTKKTPKKGGEYKTIMQNKTTFIHQLFIIFKLKQTNQQGTNDH